MKKENKIISPQQAKLLLLNSQQLLKPDFGKNKQATLTTIQHLGYIQIDTLAVVARAHHHTLWSRLPHYKETYLNELLENDKSIFEYWSHAASYLPMTDYRFSLPLKKAYSDGKSHWFGQDKKMNKYVLDKIKAEGALQSKDFQDNQKRPGMWNWKPAKRALEQLFMEGKLMVEKRQGFQKVYNLTERVLPKNVDASFPSEKEHTEHLIKRAIQQYGLVNENEISYLRKGLKASVNKSLKHLLKEGEIIEINIAGAENDLFITTEQQLKSIENIKTNSNIHLLSPFDNAVIQRKKLQRIFNFDYIIECYLPEPKRKYGYFTLPVLYNNNFVARLDPKADRATKTFYIKSIHFEKHFIPDEKFNVLFADKLKAFAAFTGCTKIVIEKADAKWKKAITPTLKPGL
jgi:uncharacterized protein